VVYSPSKSPKGRWLIPWVIALAVFITLFGSLVHLLTESWWFEAVGFQQVFWIRIRWQLALGLGTFVLYFLWLWLNYRLAQRLTRDRDYVALTRNTNTINTREQIGQLVTLGFVAAMVFLAGSAGLRGAAGWETILKFLNPTSFDVTDPIFQRDVGFYVFQLPFWQGVQANVLGALIWALLIAVGVYALKGEVRPERGWKYFLTGEVKTHLCVLLAAIAITMATGFWLDRFSLVFGAGYTDVHARLQAYWLMGFLTLAVAVLFMLAIWRSGFSLPVFGMGLYLGVLLLVNGLYPWFQQNFVVEPNELTKERPYIEHNIAFTRAAYGLSQVEQRTFPAEADLDWRICGE
jgi:uncharacterized membrane protein (UPF0182 family)